MHCGLQNIQCGKHMEECSVLQTVTTTPSLMATAQRAMDGGTVIISNSSSGGGGGSSSTGRWMVVR